MAFGPVALLEDGAARGVGGAVTMAHVIEKFAVIVGADSVSEDAFAGAHAMDEGAGVGFAARQVKRACAMLISKKQ